MQILAFIDLDGVVCDNSARFARATANGKINWGLTFHPPLLKLDTLIANADQSIFTLEQEGWKISYLSSRPDRLCEASETWLGQYGLGGRELILRPAQKGGIRTPQWKATVVHARGAQAEHAIFVDDEGENREAARQMWGEHVGTNRLRLFESLALAAEVLNLRSW